MKKMLVLLMLFPFAFEAMALNLKGKKKAKEWHETKGKSLSQRVQKSCGVKPTVKIDFAKAYIFKKASGFEYSSPRTLKG